MFLWFWISGKLLFCIGIFMIITDFFLLREECLSLRSFNDLVFVGFMMRW